MFEALNERLTGVFDRITGRGALSEKDVAEVVVLPEPCRPAIRMTAGGVAFRLIGTGSSPPSISTRPS